MSSRPLPNLLSALSLGVILVASAAQAAEPCPSLEPGKRLGDRFSIGTVLKAPESLVADGIPGWFRPTDPAGHAVRLRFDANKLVEIEALLPKCLTLGTRKLEPAEPRVLAAALGTCAPMQINDGGNLIECEGLSLVSGAAAGAAAPTLRISDAKKPAASCTTYVEEGRWYDAAGAHAGRLELDASTRACADGVPTVLTAKLTRTEFKKLGLHCTEKLNYGATHLTCGALTFSFAGPPETLSAISAE